jgi:hypothetical protein
VRVTIIATGFEVSNIPGLDDAVGKTTVDEAIEIHYNKAAEPVVEPAVEPQKQEEEKTLDDDILSTPIEIPLHEHRQPIAHESGDIVIDFGDEIEVVKPAAQPTSTASGFKGWMRGRK